MVIMQMVVAVMMGNVVMQDDVVAYRRPVPKRIETTKLSTWMRREEQLEDVTCS